MTAIPNSFSMDELSNMLENAPQEDDLHAAVANNADKELTPEQMEELAEEVLEYAYSKCTDPLVHKVVAMRVIHNMVEWHMQDFTSLQSSTKMAMSNLVVLGCATLASFRL